MAEPIYLENLAVGDIFLSDHYTLDAEQIIRYAKEFDPQTFHLDQDAAKDTYFQGLAASGWQTAGITMRLLVESLPLARGVIGAGAEIVWPQATRPGDVLHVTSTILSITPSRSKPDRGFVVAECITSNQKDEVVQRMVSKILCFKKTG